MWLKEYFIKMKDTIFNMKDNKLSPKIKLGCSKCNGISDEDLNLGTGNFRLSKENKVTSIVSKSKKSSKVVSLF